MKLSELRENPNNPSKCSEQDLERLAGKLKRVPLGLTAMRIAYITDDPEGGKMVISGNKRLRVLKRAYGEDAELPDEYFQDVTAMSEAERHEFIVTANTSDGEWDLDMLLEQYAKEELCDLGLEQIIEDLAPKGEIDDLACGDFGIEEYNKEKKEFQITFMFPIESRETVEAYIDRVGKKSIVDNIIKEAENGN